MWEVLKAGRECRAVVTVEEHLIFGGLGEACASALVQAGVSVPFRIAGIPDEDTVTGAPADSFRHYGIREIARVMISRSSRVSASRTSAKPSWSSTATPVIIGVLNNGLVLLEVSPFWQQVIKGFVILAAVAIDKMNQQNP